MKNIFISESLGFDNKPEGCIFILEANTKDLTRKACEVTARWLETEEGKEFYKKRDTVTWTNLIVNIPKEFCEENGLKIQLISERSNLVNADDPLVRKAYDIEWDTDGEEIPDLPNEVWVPGDIEDEYYIENYLSDTYGFCLYGFKLDPEFDI